MRYTIKMDELESLVKKIVYCVQNDINKQIELLRGLTNSIEWEGMARDNAIAEYNKIIDESKKLSSDIENYVTFINMVIKSYREGNMEIDLSFKKYQEYLETKKG